VSQLAGFTKKDDLEYFLNVIAQIKYRHIIELAPTKDILDNYKKKIISWSDYECRFKKLLIERQVEKLLRPEEYNNSCLLCSEATADKCHRRLVAEYLRDNYNNVVIQHL
jgi:uncharacterized protein YeaO (DUF488 family)